MIKVKMGQRVREVILGIEGIAVAITTELNGNRRIAIQQKAREDGTAPELFDHDEVGVDVLDDGIVDRVVPIPAAADMFSLGDRVRDTANGFEGIITTRHDSISGCARFCVMGPVNRNGETPQGYIDFARLERVGEPVKALVETPQTRTGGPRTRSAFGFGRRG